MKIDRLLGIVMVLLNRQIVSARALAEKFEVSLRTIGRDIEALNLAGIPVTSLQGVNGGYGIIDGYKIDKQIMNTEDYLFIITALKGLCTGYQSRGLEITLEKVMALLQKQEITSQIQLDFSVLREGTHTDAYLKTLEKAMREKRVIAFEYINAQNTKTLRRVEPLVVTYKWYAWYLLGFCKLKEDYRLFRLSRIRELQLTELAFSKKHEAAETLLERQFECDNRTYIDIKMVCQLNARIWIEEYFPKARIAVEPKGQLLIELRLPEDERGWLGILMSLGNQIKVLEPAGLQAKLAQLAKEILETYP